MLERLEGILKHVTEHDEGLIHVPMLTPHLEFRILGEEQVMLVAEKFNTLLGGGIFPTLLPLIDGKRDVRELEAMLESKCHTNTVQTALKNLGSSGYIVSAEHGLEKGSAAFWTTLGVSPRFAEEQIKGARVSLIGDDGKFEASLRSVGIDLYDDDPTLVVQVVDDYLSPELDAFNKKMLESGGAWMPIRLRGIESLIGPVFRPREGGACWECLAYRMRSHQEVHNFVRNRFGEENAFVSPVVVPFNAALARHLVTQEILKWIVLKGTAAICDHVLAWDVSTSRLERHRVSRRPQCRACGDEILYRADRVPQQVKLHESPKRVWNSGGVRTLSPERTFERYQHLVSPVSGIVSWLRKPPGHLRSDWLHVHWAGSNHALQTKSLSTLRRSLRSKAAGKGSTSAQSKASALCESIERYSGAFHNDEIRVRRRYVDFNVSREEIAIHPNDVQLFSNYQLNNAEVINAEHHPYNVVPQRFQPEQEMDWTPLWSFTQHKHVYLPTSMLYSRIPETRQPYDLIADSNGCAAGNTLEEAIYQGFLELVERDAFAIWWYNTLEAPKVDLRSFSDEYLHNIECHYDVYSRELWVLDITSDLGIPTFVALSRRYDQEDEFIIYGAGAHLDAEVAVLRAVCECNQFLNVVADYSGSSKRTTFHTNNADAVALDFWENTRTQDHKFLGHGAKAKNWKNQYWKGSATYGIEDDIRRCIDIVQSKGMDFLVLDQTRPDIGMPVARTVVPGLRHFWPRFAPGRLYDVPVEMKKRRKPLRESELNPLPVIV